MRKIVIFASLIGTAISTPVMASNWQYVGVTSDDKTSIYIDLESRRDSTDVYQKVRLAWFKMDESNNASVPQRESKNLYQFKCDRSELRLTQWINYKADGSVLSSGSEPSYTQFKVAAPDSVGDSMLAKACF